MEETCFFSPSLASHATPERPYIVGAFDMVDPGTGLGKYSGQSLEEARKRYPDARIETYAEATRLTEGALICVPKQIDKARFVGMLDTLPPARWQDLGSEESFHYPEPVSRSVVMWFVRIDQCYFEVHERCGRTHADLVRVCREAFPSLLA